MSAYVITRTPNLMFPRAGELLSPLPCPLRQQEYGKRDVTRTNGSFNESNRRGFGLFAGRGMVICMPYDRQLG